MTSNETSQPRLKEREIVHFDTEFTTQTRYECNLHHRDELDTESLGVKVDTTNPDRFGDGNLSDSGS